LRYYHELVKLNNKLCEMNKKLDEISGQYKVFFEVIQHSVQVDDGEQKIMSLPKHLQQTFLALTNLRNATASMVADITGKQRAVEFSYLNQLTTMGYVFKKRVNRKAVFNAVNYHHLKEMNPIKLER